MTRSLLMTVGPNAAGGATSNLVRTDDYLPSLISLQCNVVGTVNYTVQTSLDDPNDPGNPVPLANMVWVSSSNSAAVGATGTIQTNFNFAPKFIRILLNSGTGSVAATMLQSGSVPM